MICVLSVSEIKSSITNWNRIEWNLFNITLLLDAHEQLQDKINKCEKSLQISNQKCSPIRSLEMVVCYYYYYYYKIFNE